MASIPPFLKPFIRWLYLHNKKVFIKLAFIYGNIKQKIEGEYPKLNTGGCKPEWPNSFKAGAVIRFNADFSEKGVRLLKEFLERKSDTPIVLAVKMGDLEEEPKYLELCQALRKKFNVELACHGYGHRKLLPLMNYTEKKEEIRKSMCSFKKYFDRIPEGFFASSNSYDKESLKLLSQYGVLYYSSSNNLFPSITMFGKKRILDITLQPCFREGTPLSKLRPILDFINEEGGVISSCYHLNSLDEDVLEDLNRVISYLEEKNFLLATGHDIAKYCNIRGKS